MHLSKRQADRMRQNYPDYDWGQNGAHCKKCGKPLHIESVPCGGGIAVVHYAACTWPKEVRA